MLPKIRQAVSIFAICFVICSPVNSCLLFGLLYHIFRFVSTLGKIAGGSTHRPKRKREPFFPNLTREKISVRVPISKSVDKEAFRTKRMQRVGGRCKPSRERDAAPLSCAAEMLRRFPAVIGNEVPGVWPGIQVEPRVATQLLALNRKNRFGAFFCCPDQKKEYST